MGIILTDLTLDGGISFIGEPPPPTPVLWYDPSSSTSYPGSGTTITNLGPTSLSGTMSNITFTNPYFTYNGSSSQVSVPDNAVLEPGSGSWTMEAWAYQTNSTGTQTILGKFDNGGQAQHSSYSIRVSSGIVSSQFGSGSVIVNSTAFSMTLNTWYQIVYVWTNSGGTKTLQTFINGSSIGTVNHSFSSVLNSSNNLFLGSYNGGEYSQYFNGRIGITRLYNLALTSNEVLQNYNTDKSKYGL